MLKNTSIFVTIVFLLSSFLNDNTKLYTNEDSTQKYTSNKPVDLDYNRSTTNKSKHKKYTDKEQILQEGNKSCMQSPIRIGDIKFGDDNSKIVLVEYFSPTCTYCANYHKHIFPLIKKQFIDTGKIQYIMRELIGNKQDLDAMILARCTQSQDMYIKFMDIILDDQHNWMHSKDYRRILTDIGIRVGVSAKLYNTCINDKSRVESWLKNTKIMLEDPCFIGVPTFFINEKQFIKPYTLYELSKAINELVDND